MPCNDKKPPLTQEWGKDLQQQRRRFWDWISCKVRDGHDDGGREGADGVDCEIGPESVDGVELVV